MRTPSRPWPLSWCGVVLGLALSCSRAPPAFSDCPDLDCRERVVREAWERDPDAGAALVLSVEDPVEQLALVERIAHALPGRLGPLCARLPTGQPAWERCQQTNSRPHLGRRDPGAGAVAPELEGLGVAVPAAPRPPGVVAPGTCEGAASRDSCLRRRAEKALRMGAVGDALALCHADGDGLQADECTFRLAERLLQQPPERIPLDPAQELCQQAGALAGNCLGHVVLAVARAAPPADAAPEGWAGAVATLERLLAHWSAPEAAALREELEDLFWAEATRHSVAGSPSLSAAASAVLPPQARPHLRCALGAALLAQADQNAELGALSLALQAVMDGRPVARSQAAAPLRRHPLPALDGAASWAPAAGASPRHMMGLGRRWSVDDPLVDGELCLVEAAARLDPPRRELLEQGSAAEAEVVRKTAERLVAAQGAGARPPGPGSRPPR